MNTVETQHIGIDLTQHKPILGIAHGRKILETKILTDSPPQALLPVVSGEAVLGGAVAHEHRRGMGKLWPPECQVPVYGDPLNGVGRVPLFCAWAKFLESNKKGFAGKTGNTDISWRPSGNHEISVSAERLIADSVKAWTKSFGDKYVGIVVPDSFNEAAQQALLDHCNGFLVPRPVAVALTWCRCNAEIYQGWGNTTEEGVSIGHILVVTMSLDQWEVVPIEIRARKFRDRTWLIPVRTWHYNIGGFPRFGIGVLTGITNVEIEDTNEIWRRVFSLGESTKILEGEKIIGKKEIDALGEFLEKGFTSRDRRLFGRLSIWANIISNSDDISSNELGKEISKIYKKQLKSLQDSISDPCLAVVVDGACAKIRISEESILANVLMSDKKFKDTKIIVGNGHNAAQGAAYTIAAMKQNLPSYRERIKPIEIHHHRYNKKHDLENAWKPLIKGTTITAGKEYESEEPIKGMEIGRDSKELKLTLKRPGIDEYDFREIKTVMYERAEKNEPVEISVRLRPGQGFAKVTIESTRDGFFRTLLNWRNMQPCGPPPPPSLAYLPEVSRIEQHFDLWQAAEQYLTMSIEALKTNATGLKDILDLLRINKLNSTQLADNYDESKGRSKRGELFLYYSVFPSNGEVSGKCEQRLTAEFIKQSENYFSRPTNERIREAIQRTASWLYLKCPPSIISSVKSRLKEGYQHLRPVDLHTIGLCFDKPEDIKLFFKAFEKRLRNNLSGTNEWLRTSRNIVRFRDDALKPEIIEKNSLENIFNMLIEILKNRIYGEMKELKIKRESERFKQIFNNCVLMCLYFLKRRRYEPNFLGPDTDNFKTLEEMFEYLKKGTKGLNDHQLKIIKTTLEFIRGQGTLEGLRTIMEEQ